MSKVSICLDCGTPIIGGQFRCLSCNNRHETLLRKQAPTFCQVLITGLVASMIIVGAILMIASGGDCL